MLMLSVHLGVWRFTQSIKLCTYTVSMSNADDGPTVYNITSSKDVSFVPSLSPARKPENDATEMPLPNTCDL